MIPASEEAIAPVPGGSPLRLFGAFCFAGALLGLLPLWNGPMYISAVAVGLGLFVLLPMRRYTFGFLAAMAVLGLPQILLWRSGGGTVAAHEYPAFHFGYVVDEATVGKVAQYLAFTFGFKWLLLAVALVLAHRVGRSVLVASFGVMAVALLVQFSVDLPTNHKFFYFWVALANVGAAYALYRIAKLGWLGGIGAALLTVLITVGGAIDLVPFFRDETMDFPMENDRLMEWVKTRTDPRDVFLTDTFVAHTILLAGRKLFMGYEYYAWSAGYNMEARNAVYKQLYSERDANVLVGLLNENDVRYVCFDDGFSQGKVGVNEFVYRAWFQQVFADTEGRYGGFRIYKVPRADEWAILAGVPIRPLVEPTPKPIVPLPPPEQLAGGLGLAVAQSGELLVAEASTGAVQKASAEGQFLGSLGLPNYKEPNSVAVDPRNGEIYVADTWQQRIVHLSPDGTTLGELASPPSGFYAPRDVKVASNGHVFVMNTGKCQVVHYDAAGAVVGTWGQDGTADGQFKEPLSLAVTDDEIFVADFQNQRVQVFAHDGRFLRKWPVPEWQGSAEYRGLVAFDGHVFVADPVGNRVLIFSPQGAREGEIARTDIKAPSGLAVSKDARLYVANLGTGKIAFISLK